MADSFFVAGFAADRASTAVVSPFSESPGAGAHAIALVELVRVEALEAGVNVGRAGSAFVISATDADTVDFHFTVGAGVSTLAIQKTELRLAFLAVFFVGAHQAGIGTGLALVGMGEGSHGAGGQTGVLVEQSAVLASGASIRVLRLALRTGILSTFNAVGVEAGGTRRAVSHTFSVIEEESLCAVEAAAVVRALVTSIGATLALIGVGGLVVPSRAGFLTLAFLLEEVGRGVTGIAPVLRRAVLAVHIRAGDAGSTAIVESCSAVLNAGSFLDLQTVFTLNAAGVIAGLATLGALVTLVVVSVEAYRAVVHALTPVEHSRLLAFLAGAEVLLAVEARTLGASLASVILLGEVVRAVFNTGAVVDDVGELADLAVVLIMALKAVLCARFADSAVSEASFRAGSDTLVVVEHQIPAAKLASAGVSLLASIATSDSAVEAGVFDSDSGGVAGHTVLGVLVEEVSGNTLLAVSFVVAVFAVGGALSAGTFLGLVEGFRAGLDTLEVVDDPVGITLSTSVKVSGLANVAVFISALVASSFSQGES